jgi:hypothetical protein
MSTPTVTANYDADSESDGLPSIEDVFNILNDEEARRRVENCLATPLGESGPLKPSKDSDNVKEAASDTKSTEDNWKDFDWNRAYEELTENINSGDPGPSEKHNDTTIDVDVNGFFYVKSRKRRRESPELQQSKRCRGRGRPRKQQIEGDKCGLVEKKG